MRLRLQNAVLPSSHFEETVAFYRNTLGLEVLQEGPGFCFFRAGSANIAVHQAEGESDFAPTGRGIYLDLLVDDLAAARSALEEAAVPIRKEWRDHNGEFLLVADPEGNLLEVYRASADDERTA
jgi:catechol 2,3-dioxygenase-like lactoylglutathione lyase family enzyme